MQLNQPRPERPIDPQKSEPRILGIAGLALLALAIVFGWQELALQPEMVTVLVSVVIGAGALIFSRSSIRIWGPLAVIAATAVSGLWYMTSREPVLIAGLAISFAAAVTLVVIERHHERLDEELERWHRLISWHAIALSGLASSFAVYFHLFDASDLGLQQFVVRRVVLTLTWLVSGTGLVLLGRANKRPEMRDAGFLVLAVSLLKMLAYDLTHVDGVMRIAALAVGGVILVGAAHIAGRLNRASGR